MLTIRMELEERQQLKKDAVRLCADSKLEAPTIAALVRAAVREFLEKHSADETAMGKGI